MTALVGQLQIILVADRKVHKAVVPNVAVNVTKLAAPLAFVAVGAEGAYLAQNVSVLIGFCFISVIIAKGGQRFRPQLSLAATRQLRRFSAESYIAGLVGGLPLQVLPLILLNRFGSDQIAYWYTAMAIATILYLLPANVSQALLAEAASDASSRRALIRRAGMMIALVMIPVLSAVYVGAPLGLRLLGHQYTSGTVPTLRWLVLAGVLSSINYITGTILYIAKKTFAITVTNVVDAIVVIGLATVWATDVKTVAIAWFIGEIGNVILFWLFAAHALRQVNWRWEELGGG